MRLAGRAIVHNKSLNNTILILINYKDKFICFNFTSLDCYFFFITVKSPRY